MTTATRNTTLRYVLIATGVIFTFGIYPLTRLWQSGWAWGVAGGHSHYAPMIVGVYAVLGLFLIAASRDPLANRSLIWFTVWSSVAHAVIMAVQALRDPAEVGHLWGDVPALLVVAVALGLLMPRGASLAMSTGAAGARRAA